MRLNQDDTITSDSKFPITNMDYLLNGKLHRTIPIINHDKIVSGSLVFEKGYLHRCKLIPQKQSRRLKNKVPTFHV